MIANHEPVERYLAQLQKSLQKSNVTEAEEILSDIRSHISSALYKPV